jgi:hypothetical protein
MRKAPLEKTPIKQRLNPNQMKRKMYIALLAIGVASCQKETVTPCSNPETTFQNQLKGHYEEVGFKTSLFSQWSYTTTGPEFDITQDSITGAYASKYQVMDPNTIYLQNMNQLVDVTFGDTVVFAFQNGDSTKLIKQ